MFHSKVLGMTWQQKHKQTIPTPSPTHTQTVLIPFISLNTGEKACSVPRILQRLNREKGAESTENSSGAFSRYII